MTSRKLKEPLSPLKDWAREIRKYLAILTTLAGFVISLVGGFVQPIAISSEERSALLRLTPFLITVLAGLIFLLSQKWSRRKQANRWFFICAACFFLSVLSLLAYRHLAYDRTCVYDSQRIIVGTTYTDKGRSYTAQHPNKTCEEVLDDFTGEVEAVWTKESINSSRLALEFSYIVCISLFAVCLLALGQAAYSYR